MPYPNEHACRIRNPDDFEEGSFRRVNIGIGIGIITGRLKGKSASTTQSYRFKTNNFTSNAAKIWLKEHNVNCMSFEAASG